MDVVGNLNFDGNVNIGNASANVDFGGDVQIAGDTGETAIDNHVDIGMDSPEFPAPDVNRFLQYAIGDVVDGSTDLTKGITLTNATIKGGSGIHFSGNMNAQIKGSIINYANSSTLVEGNATMNFDRVGSVKIPAGFDLYRELDYEPASYSETGS